MSTEIFLSDYAVLLFEWHFVKRSCTIDSESEDVRLIRISRTSSPSLSIVEIPKESYIYIDRLK